MRERRTETPLVGRDDELARVVQLAGDPATGAVLLTGPTGVGKSRLAEGALAALAPHGWRGVGLTATESAGRVAYASLSELIPHTLDSLGEQLDGQAERTVLRAVEDALDLQSEEPLAVVVDDVASFDVASCELLVHLAANRRLFIVAAQTLDPGLADAVARLTPAGLVELDVAPLDVTGTAELAALILGGPVGPGLVRDLWTRTQGNPLFIRELVDAASTEGTVREHEGVYQLTDSSTIGPSLGRQIVFRLGLLTRTERDVLELLALAGKLGVDDLVEIAGAESLEIMERRGLVTTVADRRRLQATLGHPLHGEAIVADLTPLALRRRYSELVSLLGARPTRRAEDSVLLARARLAAGSPDPVETQVEAVYLALRLDRIRDASELAEAAFEAEPAEPTRTAYAEALIRQGRFAEADGLLASPVPDDADEWTRLRRAIRRSSNQLWGFRDAAAAHRIDLECIAELSEQEAISRVVAHQAWIDYCDGEPEAALVRSEPLVAIEHPDVRFAVCAVRAPALVIRGRVIEGAELAQRAWDNGWGADTEYGSHGQHLIALGFGRLYEGDLAAARFVADQAIAVCRANSETTPLLFFLDLAAWAELLAGDLLAALAHFDEATAIGTDVAIASSVRSSLAGASLCHAQLGQPDEASATWRRLLDMPPAPGPRGGAEIATAEAWVEVAAGQPSRGAELLRGAAQAAASSHLRVPELLLLLDLSRIGYATPEDAAQAEAAALDCEGELCPVIARSVAATSGADPRELDACASRFGDLGYELWSAELAGRASDAWSAAGDQRAATASQLVVDRARAKLGPAATPGLARRVAVDPLTRREREVAGLASSGATNAEIASQLHVSVRTVETHLARIYRKLGISGRSALSAALGSARE